MFTKRLVLTAARYLFACHMLMLTLHAQTGNISGTVTDWSRRAVLVGAQVRVEGQSVGASTDDSGRYRLLAVPAGSAKVTVSYLGFESLTQDVTVPAGSTVALDFTLGLSAESSAVTVTDSPDLVGQERALNDQKNSINL